MYDKLKKVHEQDDTRYYAKVKVHFSFEDPERMADSVVVQVPFTIDVEHRSWGIKGIDIFLNDIIQVDYLDQDPDGNEVDKFVKVDLSKLRQDWYEGGSYTVDELNLFIKKDGDVDYAKSSVDLRYVKKD